MYNNISGDYFAVFLASWATTTCTAHWHPKKQPTLYTMFLSTVKIEAFKRAFQIYHTGRFWKFGDGIVPSVEDFVEGRFRLVPGGMLQTVCRTDAVGGGSAADPVLFVKSPELQEVRIGHHLLRQTALG